MSDRTALICVISSTPSKDVPAVASTAGTPGILLALTSLSVLGCLDDAKQPQDEDQQQDAAKTDIHDTLLLLVLLLKRGAVVRRSSRFGVGTKFGRYYFTRRQSTGFA